MEECILREPLGAGKGCDLPARFRRKGLEAGGGPALGLSMVWQGEAGQGCWGSEATQIVLPEGGIHRLLAQMVDVGLVGRRLG